MAKKTKTAKTKPAEEKKKVKKPVNKKKITKKPGKKRTAKTSVKKAAKKATKKSSKFVLEPVDLKDLLEAGCHFGHKKSKTNPKATRYIYTIRDGIAIFDLAKTKKNLEKAQKFVQELIKKNKKVVFLGTKRQAREIVKEEAKRVNMPYIVNRWLGGTITNWDEIKANSVDKLNKLKKDWAAGKFKKRTKREQSLIKREINRLEQLVGGISQLDELFDALFVVDIKAEETAIKEANIRGIPVIAIIDTNCDPSLVNYPIPANDDAAKSIQLLVREIGKVIKPS